MSTRRRHGDALWVYWTRQHRPETTKTTSAALNAPTDPIIKDVLAAIEHCAHALSLCR